MGREHSDHLAAREVRTHQRTADRTACPVSQGTDRPHQEPESHQQKGRQERQGIICKTHNKKMSRLMKNLKQLVLPCYKLEMAMSVEAWYFLHGSTDGICNLTYLLSLLSKMTVSEVQNTKRGLGYAVHPGQADGSMLVLAKEWGIGRKAVSRLLEDFSERGLIRVDSNPVTSIIDMVCVKSWMIAGRLIENPAYRQTVKAYEGVRIFLFNGQQLETLRRSSARKKKEKPTEETAEGTDGLPSMNPTDSNPIIEETGTAETETAATTESDVKSTAENAVVDTDDNTPFLEEDSTLSGSQEWEQPQE